MVVEMCLYLRLIKKPSQSAADGTIGKSFSPGDTSEHINGVVMCI